MNNNFVIYILLLILLVVVGAILILLYLQNKERSNNFKNNGLEDVTLNDEKDEKAKVREVEDLQSLSKELEQLPKEQAINMTQYELEQEQQAIISYDELISQVKDDKYQEETISGNDNVAKEQGYEHEEEVLKELKQLRNILN